MAKKYPQIYTDLDFIVAPQYNDSMIKFLKAHPNGASVAIICRVLRITREEYLRVHDCAIAKMRDLLKVSKND